MTRHFSGFHMLALIVGFFAVVVGVNMVMATFAVRTFGGTVVDNSYVASQKFNRWLDEAQAQEALAWNLTAAREGDRAVILLPGLPDATMKATAIHPLGRAPSIVLHFQQVTPGKFRSAEMLPAGRWRLEIGVQQGVRTKNFVSEVPA